MKTKPLTSFICNICILTAVTFFPHTLFAQQSEILPLCGVVATADEWNNLNPAVSMIGDSGSVAAVIKKGLHYNCATQLRMALRRVIEPNRSYWESSHLTILPTARAVPDTFWPENGVQQLVHLSIDAPALSNFRTCYPGYRLNPNEYCTYETFSSGADTGVLLYRLKHEDGTFHSSPWIATLDGVPGFILRQKGECLTPRTGCEYEIIFPKNPNGTFMLQRDAQVLIQVPVYLGGDYVETDGFNSTMAIPLLLKAGTPDPTPAPPADPNPTLPPAGPSSPPDPTSPDQGNQPQLSVNQVLLSWVSNARDTIGLIKEKAKKTDREEQKALRTQLNDIIKALSSHITDNGDTIVVTNKKFNLNKKSKQTVSALRSFMKKSKKVSFKTRKRKALKALKTLEKGVTS